MKKTRTDKQLLIDELRDKFRESTAVFVSDYRGLKVSEITELRNRLRPLNAEYKVVKNTLARLAIKDTPSEVIKEFIDGPVAVAFTKDGPVEVAKAIKDFAGEFQNLKIKGGLLGEGVLSVEDVDALSKLPSREVLLTKLAGLLNMLPASLVTLLNRIPQRLVLVLTAIQKEKE